MKQVTMKQIMMRKVMSFMLVFSCVAACLAGCGGSGSSVDGSSDDSQGGETIHFTVSTSATNSAGDYNSDSLAEYIAEKFNVTWEVYPVAADSFTEKVRVWVTGGNMPTMTTWTSFNLSEYYEYVDQGLLCPLPEGWEETYPNLSGMVEKTGMLEYMTVDGLVYAIPHAVFGNFADFDVITAHDTLFYRKDWAADLGFDFGDTCTLSEFKAYLEACVENDMSGTGTTYGLTATAAYMNAFFMTYTGIDYDGFVETEDDMEWGPSFEAVPEAIKTMREWYQDGLLHPDYFSYESSDISTFFEEGYSAAIYRDGPVSVYGSYDETRRENGWPEDSLGSVVVTDDEGQVYAFEGNNYWSVTLFNPDNDAETMERILELTDWLCTDEGIYYTQLGIPDVDWDLDEDGYPYMLEAAMDEEGNVISQWERNNSFSIWRQLGYLSDDFDFVSPNHDTEVQDKVSTMYEIKSEADVVIPYNMNYAMYSGEAKSVYSVSLVDAVTALVLSEDDIDAGWAEFIEDNKGMWQPLLEALNETYYSAS